MQLLLLTLHLLGLKHANRLRGLRPQRVVSARPLLRIALAVQDRQCTGADRLDDELAVLIVGVEREVLDTFLT